MLILQQIIRILIIDLHKRYMHGILPLPLPPLKLIQQQLHYIPFNTVSTLGIIPLHCQLSTLLKFLTPTIHRKRLPTSRLPICKYRPIIPIQTVIHDGLRDTLKNLVLGGCSVEYLGEVVFVGLFGIAEEFCTGEFDGELLLGFADGVGGGFGAGVRGVGTRRRALCGRRLAVRTLPFMKLYR